MFRTLSRFRAMNPFGFSDMIPKSPLGWTRRNQPGKSSLTAVGMRVNQSFLFSSRYSLAKPHSDLI
jgi:hypothetical protein